jgi:ferredoxin
MSVFITFEQDGGSGLVPVGATLRDAAKRLGVRLSADCKGLVESDGCAVQVTNGSEALSPATEAELKTLGAERLLAGERLACQTVLIKSADVKLRVVPMRNAEGKEPAARTLPFKQQLGAFIETEANAITDAVNMIRGKSSALVEKFLNLNQEKKPREAEKDQPQA